MIVDGTIERMVPSNVTAHSIIDTRNIKVKKLKGGMKMEGSIDVLVDLSDGVEVSAWNIKFHHYT